MLATQLRWKRTNSRPPSIESPRQIITTLATPVLKDFGEMMEQCFPVITVNHVDGDALTRKSEYTAPAISGSSRFQLCHDIGLLGEFSTVNREGEVNLGLG